MMNEHNPLVRAVGSRLAVLCTVLVLGCTQTHSPDRGTGETHFLCNATRDCSSLGTAFRCMGGRCQIATNAVQDSGAKDAGHSTHVLPDASATPDAAYDSGPSLARAPQKHRPGASCPTQRGPGTFVATEDAGIPSEQADLYECSGDADCTAGLNGRCNRVLPHGGPSDPRLSACSYDRCFDDSECALAMCVCRDESVGLDVNLCEGAGNCRVDSDCGPNGYCSPSLVNAHCACFATVPQCDQLGGMCFANGAQVPCACDVCDHGYFCHTKQDGCIDDSDCGQGTCNYDKFEQRWSCSVCGALP